MRILLAFAIVALGAAPAAAQQAGDRYGYGPNPRAQSAAIAQPPENQGFRALTWASKTRAQTVPATTLPATPARPQSRALAGQYEHRQGWTRDLPPSPSARPAERQPTAYQPFTPQAPYYDQPQQVAALTPPPIRQAPAPVRAALVPKAAPTPRAAARPDRGPPLAGPSPAPQAAAAPVRQMAQAAAPHAGEGVHYYSLHRAYGLTPDAIPEPPQGQRYVLMGPPDPPRAKAADRDDDDNDDAPAGKPSRPF